MQKQSLTMLINAALASLADTSQRFFRKKEIRDQDFQSARYLPNGTRVTFWYRSRKTTTAAALKRAAKKRANMRARSKK